MGLLDFDVGKITGNDAFQLGMNIMGNNQGYGGNTGMALGAGLQDYQRQKSLQAQQARANAMAQQQQANMSMQKEQYDQQKAQALMQQERQANLAKKYPQLSGMPKNYQDAFVKQQFAAPKAPTAFDQKLGLYRKDPKAYKGMFPGRKTEINMNSGMKSGPVSDENKAKLGLDPKVPYFWDKNQKPVPVKKTNFSDSQAQAASFADRMEKAELRMSGLMDLGHDPTTMRQMISSDGGMIGNYMASGDSQVYSQAQNDWVRAKLRKESGAVIGPKEMADEVKTYFPQPGDGPEVVKAKALSRATALRGMARMSGGAYDYIQPEAKGQPDKKQQRSEEEVFKLYGL